MGAAARTSCIRAVGGGRVNARLTRVLQRRFRAAASVRDQERRDQADDADRADARATALLGIRQESLSRRTPKVQLQWLLPLIVHPPDPPHAISPSVLDARRPRDKPQRNEKTTLHSRH